MNATFFPFAALPTSDPSLLGILTGAPVSGELMTGDMAFSQLLQQQTASGPSKALFPSFQPDSPLQQDLPLQSPSVGRESFTLLGTAKSEKLLQPNVNPLPVLDIPLFQTVEEHDLSSDVQNPEVAKGLVNPAQHGESDEHFGTPEAITRPDLLVSAAYVSTLEPERMSALVGQRTVGVVRPAEPIPVRFVETTLTSNLNNEQELRPLPSPPMAPGNAQETMKSSLLQQPTVLSPDAVESHFSDQTQAQGRVRVQVSDGYNPISEDVPSALRRPLRIHDLSSSLAPLAQHVLSSRPPVISDAFVPPQSFERSGLSPLQGLAGGTAIRSDAGEVDAVGKASHGSDALPDATGTKMDGLKASGEADRQGMDAHGNSESGMQGGLGGFTHSQSGQQHSHAQPGQTAGAVRIPEGGLPEGPTQPLQRLQLEVQISETQHVQIDVGVQHRQVYAGLVMDQMALKNLAMQFVPQLEEQLSNLNLELNQFSAETTEEGGGEAESFFQRDRFPSEEFVRTGVAVSAQPSQILRPFLAPETGLHFVA